MEMADYLGRKGVPVALVVPFDGTQSFYASPNVARVLNITQRDYAYMRRGAGFHGTLVNVDVSSDRSIDHLTIDKSPRLHARVIAEVLAIVGGAHHLAPAGSGSSPGERTGGGWNQGRVRGRGKARRRSGDARGARQDRRWRDELDRAGQAGGRRRHARYRHS